MKKSIEDLSKHFKKRVDEIVKECGVFWAFGAEQTRKAMAENPLPPGEKYCSILGGGLMPARNKPMYNDLMEEALNDFYRQVKVHNLEYQHIVYELDNHECFYTYDLEPVFGLLRYPPKQIKEVFQNELNKKIH